MSILKPILTASLLVALATASSCAHSPASAQARGLLRLQIEPPDADLYVDHDYMGSVDGWRGQTLRLPSGLRMVEVRAPGYISQRFDVEIEPDVEVTLRLQMERELDRIDLENPTDSG